MGVDFKSDMLFHHRMNLLKEAKLPDVKVFYQQLKNLLEANPTENMLYDARALIYDLFLAGVNAEIAYKTKHPNSMTHEIKE